MAFTWVRPFWSSSGYNYGAVLLASIPAGQTYVRVRFRWGVYADSPALGTYLLKALNTISAGLVTTIGDGTEVPPDARSGSGDVAPPTQRWIYWETRGMYITALDAAAGAVAWRDSGSTEPTQTEGQVAAQGLGAGQTLNLWFTWQSVSAWYPEGSAMVWGGASILVKT